MRSLLTWLAAVALLTSLMTDTGRTQVRLLDNFDRDMLGSPEVGPGPWTLGSGGTVPLVDGRAIIDPSVNNPTVVTHPDTGEELNVGVTTNIQQRFLPAANFLRIPAASAGRMIEITAEVVDRGAESTPDDHRLIEPGATFEDIDVSELRLMSPPSELYVPAFGNPFTKERSGSYFTGLTCNGAGGGTCLGGTLADKVQFAHDSGVPLPGFGETHMTRARIRSLPSGFGNEAIMDVSTDGGASYTRIGRTLFEYDFVNGADAEDPGFFTNFQILGRGDHTFNNCKLFDETNPFAGPASGNQALSLNNLQGSLDRVVIGQVTDVILEPGTEYTIEAATGNDLLLPLADQSIEMWSTNTEIEDEAGGYGQLADASTGDPGWTDPSSGEWATNSVSFTTPADDCVGDACVGEKLTILLSNDSSNNGRANYDSIRVLANGEEVWSDDFEGTQTPLKTFGFVSPEQTGWELIESAVPPTERTPASAGIFRPCLAGHTEESEGEFSMDFVQIEEIPLAAPETGDMDLDGDVDFDDIDEFVQGLNDPATYLSTFWVEASQNGDTDGDGDQDFDDIAGFVGILSGGGGVSSVPEPTTLLLAVIGVLGVVGFGWRRRKT